jgi:hypothetical protein
VQGGLGVRRWAEDSPAQHAAYLGGSPRSGTETTDIHVGTVCGLAIHSGCFQRGVSDQLVLFGWVRC